MSIRFSTGTGVFQSRQETGMCHRPFEHTVNFCGAVMLVEGTSGLYVSGLCRLKWPFLTWPVAMFRMKPTCISKGKPVGGIVPEGREHQEFLSCFLAPSWVWNHSGNLGTRNQTGSRGQASSPTDLGGVLAVRASSWPPSAGKSQDASCGDRTPCLSSAGPPTGAPAPLGLESTLGS